MARYDLFVLKVPLNPNQPTESKSRIKLVLTKIVGNIERLYVYILLLADIAIVYGMDLVSFFMK